MDQAAERVRIAELEGLRRSSRNVRWAFSILITGLVVWCLLSLTGAARNLAQQGPGQQEFIKALTDGLQHDVAPQVKAEGAAALTEIQPLVRKSVSDLGKRVPELTQLAQTEAKSFETELPNRGETILNKSYSDLLQQHTGTIHDLYGNSVTNEQVAALVATLGQLGQKELVEANQELFAPHQHRISNILETLQDIKKQEYKNVKGDQPSWDMALLLLDIFRDDLKTMVSGDQKPKPTTPSKPTDSNNKKSA
jgi:hypothetical protein